MSQTDHNIINFDDLSEIMKTMGKAVGDVTSDLNKGLCGLSEILIKMGHDLDKSEIEELDNIFVSLTEKDKEELLSLLTSEESDLKEWWNNKCDNEKLIDILVSSMDTFSQFMNIKNTLSNVFGSLSDSISLGCDSDQKRNPLENIGSMFSGILNSIDNIEPKVREPEIKESKKISMDREMLIDTAANIINLLSSFEIKLLKSKCDNLKDSWSKKLDNLETVINTLPQISDIDEIKEKINNICVDIELLRHKK